MRYKDLSDKELLEASKDNIKAYNVLFSRYSGKLYHYALKYLNDTDVAEEVMMDLLFWVWEKRAEVKIEGTFSAYIFSAMKHAMIKQIRKKAICKEPIAILENEPGMVAQSADHEIECKELEEHFQLKLHELSPQRKLVFQMSREDGFTHAQIASQLNLSVHTVKNHIKASLSHFKESFKDYANVILLLSLFSIL